MILAGIDEAGYGPLLGPLVVGCCAFDVTPEPGDDALPCLWKRLHRLVSKTRSKTGRKIHINDSKLVYSPSIGLKELERAVLTIASASSKWRAGLDELLDIVSADAASEAKSYRWYQPHPTERFPLEQEDTPIRLFANALRQEMDRTSARCVHFQAQVIFEHRFNQMLAGTKNKASALFCIAAMHLDALLRTYGTQQLVIVCDRQGGREHYAALLRLMFPEWDLRIDREHDGHSAYQLQRDGHVVLLTFREKAEAGCLPVAAASMLSKYLREALMHRFNAFWKWHIPDLAPTAGYYGDGTRFLADIATKRQELGVADEHLVRSR